MSMQGASSFNPAGRRSPSPEQKPTNGGGKSSSSSKDMAGSISPPPVTPPPPITPAPAALLTKSEGATGTLENGAVVTNYVEHADGSVSAASLKITLEDGTSLHYSNYAESAEGLTSASSLTQTSPEGFTLEYSHYRENADGVVSAKFLTKTMQDLSVSMECSTYKRNVDGSLSADHITYVDPDGLTVIETHFTQSANGKCTSTSFEYSDLPPMESLSSKMLEPGPVRLSSPQTIYPARLRLLEHFREERLQHLDKAVDEPEQNPISCKEFPKTTAWISDSKDSKQFMKTLVAAARSSGIKMVFSDQSCDWGVWTQDYFECSKNDIRMPAYLHLSQKEFQDLIQEGRTSRLEGYSEQNSFDVMGSANLHYEDKKFLAASLALQLNVPVSMNLTYNEGGNTLSGTTPDGDPYVIIGKDAKWVSEKSLGIFGEQLKKAFALDYGVKPEHVYFVEQPGTFHLDMSMSVVGPKTVILNDAVEAWERMEARHPDLDPVLAHEYRVKAETKKRFEDQAELDLKSQGFTVHRVAGDFENPVTKEKMNFFNMVQSTQPDGSKLIIALGCEDTLFEEHFKSSLQRAGCMCKNIVFLNRQETIESLNHHGGISCRVKTI
jgi:hypothetical protein